MTGANIQASSAENPAANDVNDIVLLSFIDNVERNSHIAFNFYFEQTLRKMSKFRLISWRRNFVETHSFGRVLGDFPETLQKLLRFQKFPTPEI